MVTGDRRTNRRDPYLAVSRLELGPALVRSRPCGPQPRGPQPPNSAVCPCCLGRRCCHCIAGPVAHGFASMSPGNVGRPDREEGEARRRSALPGPQTNQGRRSRRRCRVRVLLRTDSEADASSFGTLKVRRQTVAAHDREADLAGKREHASLVSSLWDSDGATDLQLAADVKQGTSAVLVFDDERQAVTAIDLRPRHEDADPHPEVERLRASVFRETDDRTPTRHSTSFVASTLPANSLWPGSNNSSRRPGRAAPPGRRSERP